MDALFQFEESLAKSLGCIPMAVRRKLDLVGIKLSLAQWTSMDIERRRSLLETQVADDPSDWEKLLVDALTAGGHEIRRLEVEASPAWSDPGVVPGPVQEQCLAHCREITASQWAALAELQRFALCKLSRAGHENRNFLLAMREFGL